MKLIKSGRGHYHFQIGDKEKALLFTVLDRYPAVPAAHQRLSKFEDKPEAQELLETTLAEHRAVNQGKVAAMLKTPDRFRKDKSGWHFSLSAAEMEWLLQALNDVRVGSWLALGSPDGPVETLGALNDRTAGHFWAMEMSGHFQAALLEALRR